MWINRKVYTNLVLAEAATKAAYTEQARQVAALTATMDWLRVRVTQLEMERAQLMYNYMGIKVPTPVIERAPEVPQRVDALPDFNDVGDAEAARLGIGWNPDGTLKFDDRK